jgi:hypothetical protein
MNPPIIGLSGKYGVGKDLAAELICAVYPYARAAFANNVKATVAAFTGVPYEAQFTREGKSTIPFGLTETCGRYQQIIGETLRKVICEDVWIKPVLKPGTIITDVRYKNEADAIIAAGGIVIRINRDTGGSDYSNGRDPNHPSEIDLDDYEFKHVVQNDGTIEDLKNAIMRILDAYQ